MTDEKLEKANKIKERINNYDDILNHITSDLRCKKELDKKCKKEFENDPSNYNARWTLSKFFTFKVNRDYNKKVKLIPHYELACGTEINVSEDFVLMVIEYFEKKKEQAEKEFAELE